MLSWGGDRSQFLWLIRAIRFNPCGLSALRPVSKECYGHDCYTKKSSRSCGGFLETKKVSPLAWRTGVLAYWRTGVLAYWRTGVYIICGGIFVKHITERNCEEIEEIS